MFEMTCILKQQHLMLVSSHVSILHEKSNSNHITYNIVKISTLLFPLRDLRLFLVGRVHLCLHVSILTIFSTWPPPGVTWPPPGVTPHHDVHHCPRISWPLRSNRPLTISETLVVKRVYQRRQWRHSHHNTVIITRALVTSSSLHHFHWLTSVQSHLTAMYTMSIASKLVIIDILRKDWRNTK